MSAVLPNGYVELTEVRGENELKKFILRAGDLLFEPYYGVWTKVNGWDGNNPFFITSGFADDINSVKVAVPKGDKRIKKSPLPFPYCETHEIVEDNDYLAEPGDIFTNNNWQKYYKVINHFGASLGWHKERSVEFQIACPKQKVDNVNKINKQKFLSDKPWPFGY